jgi:hypothetical protein
MDLRTRVLADWSAPARAPGAAQSYSFTGRREWHGGRPKVALILTDDKRAQLKSLAHRSRTAPHVARRARIILACAEIIDNKVVAKRLRMSQVTVGKRRGWFIRERLDGLSDEPRPGAPPGQ